VYELHVLEIQPLCIGLIGSCKYPLHLSVPIIFIKREYSLPVFNVVYTVEFEIGQLNFLLWE